VGNCSSWDYEDWYRGDRRDVLQAGLTKQMGKAQHRGWSGVRFCGNALQPSPDSEWAERVRMSKRSMSWSPQPTSRSSARTDWVCFFRRLPRTIYYNLTMLFCSWKTTTGSTCRLQNNTRTR
jgi:hypothetical protein